MDSRPNPKISLKLLIDNSSGKVLFAEAGKDFVDFLFGLLELPLGTVLGLFDEHGIVSGSGSLARLYESVQNLDNSCLQSNQTKKSLLRPKVNSAPNIKHTPLLKELAFPNQQEVVHETPKTNSTVYLTNNSIVFNGLTFGGSSAASNVVEGYVKGVVSYMVMDDLTVKPMSTVSSVTLLNSFRVKDIGCLQEKTVEVDVHKGLEVFMKAMYHSTTVLTDLFLPIKPGRYSSEQILSSTGSSQPQQDFSP